MGKKHLIAAEAEGDQRSLWGEAWRRFKKNRLAMIGMYFILALVIIAIATIIIDAVTGKSIYLNYVVKQDLRGRLQGPSLAHPFGWMSSAGTCCCVCCGRSVTPCLWEPWPSLFHASSAASWEHSPDITARPLTILS